MIADSGTREEQHGAFRADDAQECRPKIVAPLRYAVRFIDDDEFDALPRTRPQ